MIIIDMPYIMALPLAALPFGIALMIALPWHCHWIGLSQTQSQTRLCLCTSTSLSQRQSRVWQKIFSLSDMSEVDV